MEQLPAAAACRFPARRQRYQGAPDSLSLRSPLAPVLLQQRLERLREPGAAGLAGQSPDSPGTWGNSLLPRQHMI